MDAVFSQKLHVTLCTEKPYAVLNAVLINLRWIRRGRRWQGSGWVAGCVLVAAGMGPMWRGHLGQPRQGSMAADRGPRRVALAGNHAGLLSSLAAVTPPMES